MNRHVNLLMLSSAVFGALFFMLMCMASGALSYKYPGVMAVLVVIFLVWNAITATMNRKIVVDDLNKQRGK